MPWQGKTPTKAWTSLCSEHNFPIREPRLTERATWIVRHPPPPADRTQMLHDLELKPQQKRPKKTRIRKKKKQVWNQSRTRISWDRKGEGDNRFAKSQDDSPVSSQEKQTQTESEIKLRPGIKEIISTSEDAGLLPPFLNRDILKRPGFGFRRYEAATQCFSRRRHPL
jgi:hypothetical protein